MRQAWELRVQCEQTVVQPQHPVGLTRDRGVVSDQDDRGPLAAAEVAEQFHDRRGHRSVTVTLGKGSIPKGDTLILAFSGIPRGGTALGVGGIITGHVPHCVSLPAAP